MKKYFKLLSGYLFALICIIYVFRDYESSRFLNDLKKIDWIWILPAVFFDVMSYSSQGYRWKQILVNNGDIPVFRTTQAVYVGLLTNELIPFRVGELIRALIVSRWLNKNIIAILPSIGFERTIDGFWLFVTVGISFFYVPLPDYIINSELVLGIIVLILIILIIYLNRKKHYVYEKFINENNIFLRLYSYIYRIWRGIVLEISNIGFGKTFFKTLFGSLFIILFQIVSFHFVIISFHINFDIFQSAVAYLIVRLGTLIPNAPANIGTYQFFCILGLTIFGIEKDIATSFSIFVFFVLTLPLVIIGFISLYTSGIRISEIGAELRLRVFKSN